MDHMRAPPFRHRPAAAHRSAPCNRPCCRPRPQWTRSTAATLLSWQRARRPPPTPSCRLTSSASSRASPPPTAATYRRCCAAPRWADQGQGVCEKTRAGVVRVPQLKRGRSLCGGSAARSGAPDPTRRDAAGVVPGGGRRRAAGARARGRQQRRQGERRGARRKQRRGPDRQRLSAADRAGQS